MPAPGNGVIERKSALERRRRFRSLKCAGGTPDNGAVSSRSKNGKALIDGTVMRDMFLLRAKKPAEADSEWDLMEVTEIIPGARALRPLQVGGCPLAKACPMAPVARRSGSADRLRSQCGGSAVVGSREILSTIMGCISSIKAMRPTLRWGPASVRLSSHSHGFQPLKQDPTGPAGRCKHLNQLQLEVGFVIY